MVSGNVLEAGTMSDLDIIQQHFGQEYFVLMLFREKRQLTSEQVSELNGMAEERNHLGILGFVKKLRVAG